MNLQYCKCGMILEMIAETAGTPGFFENTTETMKYYSCLDCKKMYHRRQTTYRIGDTEVFTKQSQPEQYKGPLTRKDIMDSARYFGEKITVQ